MAEETKTNQTEETAAQTTAQEAAGEKITVKLEKPYVFENTEHQEIDLTCLQTLTIRDAIDAQRQLFGEQEVAAAVLCETTTAFARTMATKATELPVEFFKLMPRGVMKRVAAAVRGYLNVEAVTEHHVMKLEKPRDYKGKVYQEIDLNAIADLNSLNESEAENQLPVRLRDRLHGHGHSRGLLHEPAPVRAAEAEERGQRRGFFRVKGGAKALRKAAIRLSQATMTSMEFYLKMPVREFLELNNEVAEELERARRKK